jgi:hypothetical protein
MRTIESRRFVAGKAELRLFLVEEKGHRLPFRVRLKHSADRTSPPTGGVLGGFATEAEAITALDWHTQDAVASAWRQVPGQVRLILGVPAAPGAAPALATPGCPHESIQAYLPKLAPGKAIVCPECGENVKA